MSETPEVQPGCGCSIVALVIGAATIMSAILIVAQFGSKMLSWIWR